MHGTAHRQIRRSRTLVLAAGLLLAPNLIQAASLDERRATTEAVGVHGDGDIPAFARKYGMSCNVCHSPIPALTPFGETFAGNGFRMAAKEGELDTVGTGDPRLSLPKSLPLALRLDAYVRTYTNGETAADFQTPFNVKILSGGTISEKLSYYLYFFLFERGEIGGIEDAFVQINDIGDLPLDVAIGQFQISDPMFKRELRLEYQDYAIYRARIGALPGDLTYDRGIMAAADVAGFTVTGEVVNGNGRGEADERRRFDDDVGKVFFGHVTRDVIPSVRLGAMAYWGEQRGAAAEGASAITNDTWMLGGDATISLGPVEINGQYIHREDAYPTFDPDEDEAVTDGGFVEVILRPRRSHWYALALYNRIDTSRPILNARLGGPSDIDRYEALTGGIGYALRTNFRLLVEGTWDMEQDEGSLTVGLVTAF